MFRGTIFIVISKISSNIYVYIFIYMHIHIYSSNIYVYICIHIFTCYYFLMYQSINHYHIIWLIPPLPPTPPPSFFLLSNNLGSWFSMPSAILGSHFMGIHMFKMSLFSPSHLINNLFYIENHSLQNLAKQCYYWEVGWHCNS